MGKHVPSFRLREQTERANAAEEKLAELQAQSNEPDVAILIRNIRRDVANAKLIIFEDRCFYLGDVAADGLISVARAAKALQEIALANNLVSMHGQDLIQTLISEGLAE